MKSNRGTDKSEAARVLQSHRKNRRGGRPVVFHRCSICKQKFPARELRTHIPGCRKTHSVA